MTIKSTSTITKRSDKVLGRSAVTGQFILKPVSKPNTGSRVVSTAVKSIFRDKSK